MIKNYCQYCGKVIERKHVGKRQQLVDEETYMRKKYCDRLCMRKAYTKVGKHEQNWSSAHGTARNINELMMKRTQCEICGKKEKLDVHHKDCDEQNNNIENLQVLCRSCHMKIHHPKSLCLIDGCQNKVKGHGYCEKHLNRVKKYGNPFAVKRANGEIVEVGEEDLYIKRKKKIDQYTKDGEMIKTWESARDIFNNLGFFDSGINKCCNGHIKTYKGYVWRYHEISGKDQGIT